MRLKKSSSSVSYSITAVCMQLTVGWQINECAVAISLFTAIRLKALATQNCWQDTYITALVLRARQINGPEQSVPSPSGVLRT